jgi:hypothetical protein
LVCGCGILNPVAKEIVLTTASKGFRWEPAKRFGRRCCGGRAQVGSRRSTGNGTRHRADLHTLLARFSIFCIAQGRSFVAAGRWFKAMYPIRVQPAGVVGGDEIGDNALAPSTERHLQCLERQRNSKLPLSIGRCYRNCTGGMVKPFYCEAFTVTLASVLAEVSGKPLETFCK